METCNRRCPTCFANSAVGKSLNLDQVECILDCFVMYEGSPEVVQLRGEEPSIHPQIIEMIEAKELRTES